MSILSGGVITSFFKPLLSYAKTFKLVLAAGIFVYIFYLYAQGAQLRLENQELTTNLNQATKEIAVFAGEMQMLRENFESANREIVKVQEQNQKANQQIKDLHEKFKFSSGGRNRDIGRLAVAKPNLIEKTVNRGTRVVLDCFETITSGSSDCD